MTVWRLLLQQAGQPAASTSLQCFRTKVASSFLNVRCGCCGWQCLWYGRSPVHETGCDVNGCAYSNKSAHRWRVVWWQGCCAVADMLQQALGEQHNSSLQLEDFWSVCLIAGMTVCTWLHKQESAALGVTALSSNTSTVQYCGLPATCGSGSLCCMCLPGCQEMQTEGLC